MNEKRPNELKDLPSRGTSEPTLQSQWDIAAILRGLWASRQLIARLVQRDVLLRYRGAYLGLAWAFAYPLLLLAVFSLVFGRLLPARWSSPDIPVALQIFPGLIVFGLFSEVSSRATGIIRSYPSYVKKVVFPLETLPVALTLTALLHATVSLVVMAAALLFTGRLEPSFALAPLVILPAFLLSLAAGWLLAAWGVFLRDLTQLVPLLLQVTMFLCPVVYPSSAIPQSLRGLYELNPLAWTIERLRALLLTGEQPDWVAWAASSVACLAFAAWGHAVFQRSREEFADVM